MAKMDGEQSIGVSLPTTDLKPEELLPLMDAGQLSQKALFEGLGLSQRMLGLGYYTGPKMNLGDDCIEHGPVGDPGPVGDIGPPGQDLAEAEAKATGKGISLQDIISSKKIAATEKGAVVLMPQEFDADNLKAYIQQEIEAGIKEHEIALMRKVSDVLADTLVEERKAARDAAHEQSCRVGDLRAYLEAHRLEAEEFDKKRALDIAELQIKVAELEGSLTLKMQETKVLRGKLHAASMKKPVRKIGKVNGVINREHGTSKAGNDP